MKRFFFLLVTLFCCCFSWMSCSGDDNKGSGNAGSNTDEPDTPVSISLSKEALDFDSNSGYQTIVVTSSDKWTMTGDESWCRVTPTEGKSGETVTITVDTNESIEDRSTTFTFTCGSKSVKLSVLQYGIIETSYVELNLDADETTVAYSEQTGETVVTYNSGTVPDAEIGQAFVLTDEFNYDIRKITGVSKQGNKLILQTEQGDMCDLFMNIDFTLTTNPDLVADARSVGRVITPNSVEVIADGKRTVVYEKPVVMSREVFTYPHELFRLEDDFAGDKLADGEWGEVTWEEGNYDIGLDAVFFFDFGEKEVNKAKEGDLKKFRYYLDGNVDVDLLLKYETQKEYTFEKKEITRKNVIPTVTVEFMVGTIPVVVTLDTDYGTRINAVCEAGLEASAGLYLHSEAHVGLEWTKGKGITPIESFTNEYGVYDPTLNIQGSAEADFAFFPRLQFKLYKCLGPWVDLIPYMKVGAEAGAQVTLGGNNYCSWGFGVSSGLDATVGMELDMGIFDLEFFDPIDIPCMETLLFEAPQRISLQSPDNDYEMNVGEEVEITFLVESKNYLLDEYWPCAGAVVQFETNGDIKNNFALADENGMVEVNWTPLTEDDKLVAKIVDKEGEVISQAEFNPKKVQQEEMSDDDRVKAVLKSIYEQLDGDNWTHNDNWLSDAPIFEWYGIDQTYILWLGWKSGFSLNLRANNLPKDVKLNIPDNDFLISLDLSRNSLTSLSVSSNSLIWIDCEENILTSESLDVLGCTALKVLECGNNQLASLPKMSKQVPLERMFCSDNDLTTLDLDVSSYSFLKVLHCNKNQLSSLDVSGCTSLESLACYENQLSSLDVSGCTSLVDLNCKDNQLTSLDVSSLPTFGYLDCSENQLTSLNVSGSTSLVNLNCENTQLASLDVSGCTSLDYLECEDNQLTSLNASGCTSLRYLFYRNGQLTSLDVSGCTSLVTLDCSGNQLTSLDVSSCTSLRSLGCENNLINSEIPAWFSQLDAFSYDVKYEYWDEWVDDVLVTKHRDNGYGWWYPGEPGKGKHAPD